MDKFDMYRDIAERTGGDIYIGVVGPVRTGKSTFIRKVMDQLVLPNMEASYDKERVIDELPQSGTGRSIMTTQPKFIPNQAVPVDLSDNAHMRVRMVDCVGYMVKDAMGYLENEVPRMVRTPWYDYDIPFEDAAELGTRKVIHDHSTIGVMVTTDGSVTDIPRSSYIEAEEKVVNELRGLNKPFVVILNSSNPWSDDTEKLRDSLAMKYAAPVITLDVMNMSADDVNNVLEKILFEFPIRQIVIKMPLWMQALSPDHWLIMTIMDGIRNGISNIDKVNDCPTLANYIPDTEYINQPTLTEMNLGSGEMIFDLQPKEGIFYKILGDECGYPIQSDFHLVSIMRGLVMAKREYDKVSQALKSVRDTGYGLVPPSLDELKLEEPEIVRHGNRYGVRLKASAPSLHMIRVDIQTEVSPVVGTEKQSEEMIRDLLSGFENDPSKLWETQIFGRTLYDMVKDGLANKLFRMPEEAQTKMQETLQRIINEGSGGIICILL